MYNNELYHHGIKGQKWGVRRFQNDDGTLTEEGQRRYGASEERGGLRGLLEKRKARIEQENASLEPGKNLHEVSDEGLERRRERINQIQKNQRVQTILQAAMGVSLVAAGAHMHKTYSGGAGSLLKKFGMAYLLGTGVGNVMTEVAAGTAKRVIDEEKKARMESGKRG